MTSIAQQFLATANFILQDKDAGRRSFSDAGTKEEMKLKTVGLGEQIAAFQDILYAQHQHKLLVILQGMDTSGKDGTVKAVFGQLNPIGVRSVSFKAPTTIELAHDFLWRIHQQVPGAGEVVIFNRSHYEDVLITKVHAWIDGAECKRRFAHINAFERMLTETGTTILKFFLHISKDEQKLRLEERIADPSKHWKFDSQDLNERKFWAEYQGTYQEVIHATHTEFAPWHIIPANSKTQRNFAIANIVAEKLAGMRLAYPAENPALYKLKVE
jgi:PPK2 family polyphosphate:nucleotide phosphotransferase